MFRRFTDTGFHHLKPRMLEDTRNHLKKTSLYICY
jgi:hypothetical protein